MRTLKHTLIHPGLLYMFLVVGETGVPGGNLRRHGKNMQTPHRKAPSRWESNPGPSCCEARALTAVLPCCSYFPDNVESNSNHSFKYLPGKSRSHHLQMMMSKDELQEEQRVQREQLAAIFQLLKNNQDTFGDLSQGDVEEQLKLYSI
uniref:Matrix-remodeling-associated protein 7 helical domain-containing protein n=1 Tax=Neogobius melanostomus TaxID=47308 RepID=A0A8C6UMB3_9GOBI